MLNNIIANIEPKKQTSRKKDPAYNKLDSDWIANKKGAISIFLHGNYLAWILHLHSCQLQNFENDV